MSLWRRRRSNSSFFFFNDTATTEIYTLSLHDALPIYEAEDLAAAKGQRLGRLPLRAGNGLDGRSEEHTSELQSPCNLVCRLLLEKKKTEDDHCTLLRQRINHEAVVRDSVLYAASARAA